MENKFEQGLASTYGHDPISAHAMTNVMQLSVSVLEGLAELERLVPEIDALNAVAERPNPFLSGGFLLAYARHREYDAAGIIERIFLIYEGNRLIGCFPMLVQHDTVQAGNISIKSWFRSMVFLAYIDTEQPTIISSPQDQDRCAKALIDYVCRHVTDWDLIHLTGQLPSSALYSAAHAASGWKIRVRDIKVAPYNEIPITWNDLSSYFRSLSHKMRSNISRQARRLYAAGEVRLIHAAGAQGVSAWFDCYCDLDSRSWKDATPGSIKRHPGRVQLYRDIAAGNGGFDPSFIGILLDDLLVAGLILGSSLLAANQHGLWCLEMAYDRSHAKLGPGQLLLILAMGQAIEQRQRHLNFMQNFDYYKHRWGAVPINVTDVQLMRRFSARNLLAMLAELRRWIRRKAAKQEKNTRPAEDTADANETEVANTVSPELHHHSRQLAQRALVTAGSGMRVYDRGAARTRLPFDIG